MRTLVRRWWSALTLASLLLPLTALAAPPAASPEPADARAWLARIRAAANERNYEGTMVVSAGGVLSSSRVAHFVVGEQTYEHLEALDGRQQRVYRVGDSVHTLWPQARIAVLEKRPAIDGRPLATQTVEPRALEQYELLREGSERVAGREAHVFLLQPRDAMRYAQRLFADKATGLMLRADVIGPDRTVLESSAFSEVEIGVKPQPDTVTRPIKRLDGYRIVRPQLHPAQLADEGWTLERVVPGFKLAGCARRPLESAAGDGSVLQAVFSDGLTHVSLFIEPAESRREFANLSARMGATGTLRQRRGNHWITVMGDVPAATLQAFADALDRLR
jgi:sigma-E factor negative regulatory protein RseB